MKNENLGEQIKREEQIWDVIPIPEIDLNPHIFSKMYEHHCDPEYLLHVGFERRCGHMVDIYQCQYCGKEIEKETPIDETEFMA